MTIGRTIKRGGRRLIARRRQRGLDSPLLALPASAFVGIAFLVPLAVLVVYSLWATDAAGRIVTEWTFANWSRFLSNSLYSESLLRSFLFVGLASLLTTLVTLPFAYYVATKVRPQRRVAWILAAVLPFWTSYLIRVFAWLNVFGDAGIGNDVLRRLGLTDAPVGLLGFGRPAIVITFVYLLFPLSFLTSYIALERIDPRLREAAADSGAAPWRTFVRVTLPLARTGILAGFAFAFITMLGDYITPQLIGGSSGLFFSNLIVNQFGGTVQWGFGSVLSLVLVVSVLLLLLIVRFVTGASDAAGEYSMRYERQRALFLGAYSCLFMAFLYAPIALVIVFAFNDAAVVGFPITGITTSWFSAALNDPEVADAFYTSLQIALASVGISLVLGMLAAVQLSRAAGRLAKANLVLISLPLFLPPVVLGLGLLIGLHALGIARGMWTIIAAHTLLTLPVVTLVIVSRLEGLDRAQELAAMDLGARPWQTLLRVTIPQAAPAILAAALLAFAISMDEFIVTFLVTNETITLPLYIYTQMRFQITPQLDALSAMLLAGSLVLISMSGLVLFGASRLLAGRGGAAASRALSLDATLSAGEGQ